MELADVGVAEDEQVLEDPVFERQELHLDGLGLPALELDVGLFDPEGVRNGRIGLGFDAALVELVLVLVLLLLGEVLVSVLGGRLVEVVLGDEVGETDGEVDVLVEGVGDVDVEVLDGVHLALDLVGARGAAFDDARDEVEDDRRRVGDAVFRGHDREAALVLLGHARFVADGERDFLAGLDDELVVFEVELGGALDAAVVLDLLLAGVRDFDVLGADLA